jgi:hypothetical protein
MEIQKLYLSGVHNDALYRYEFYKHCYEEENRVLTIKKEKEIPSVESWEKAMLEQSSTLKNTQYLAKYGINVRPIQGRQIYQEYNKEYQNLFSTLLFTELSSLIIEYADNFCLVCYDNLHVLFMTANFSQTMIFASRFHNDHYSNFILIKHDINMQPLSKTCAMCNGIESNQCEHCADGIEYDDISLAELSKSYMLWNFQQR